MKAAKQGDAEAQYIIGSFYYYGYRPCVTDAKKAAKWLRLAAEHGHTQAYSVFGSEDRAEAEKSYGKAAAQWRRLAKCSLGCLQYGNRKRNPA